jgi:Fe-S-cluster containining protein
VARKKSGPFDGKVTRFFTSFALPVDSNRGGECSRCGACCKFLFKCPFLRSEDGKPGSFRCAVYSVRPPQCRKYPRTRSEQIHLPCGYTFEEQRTDNPRQ